MLDMWRLSFEFKKRFYKGPKEKEDETLIIHYRSEPRVTPSDLPVYDPGDPGIKERMNFSYPSWFPVMGDTMAVQSSTETVAPFAPPPNSLTFSRVAKPVPFSINDKLSPLWLDARHKFWRESQASVQRICKDETVPPSLINHLIQEDHMLESTDTFDVTRYGSLLLAIDSSLVATVTGPNMNVLAVHSLATAVPATIDYEHHATAYFSQPQHILSIHSQRFTPNISIIYFRTPYSVFFLYLRSNKPDHSDATLELIKKSTFKQEVCDVVISGKVMKDAYVLMADGTVLSLDYQSDDATFIRTILSPSNPPPRAIDNTWRRLNPLEQRYTEVFDDKVYGKITGMRMVDNSPFNVLLATESHVLMLDTRCMTRPLIDWQYPSAMTSDPVNIQSIVDHKMLNGMDLVIVSCAATGTIYVLQYTLAFGPHSLELPYTYLPTSHNKMASDMHKTPLSNLFNSSERLACKKRVVASNIPYHVTPSYGSTLANMPSIPMNPYKCEPLVGVAYLQHSTSQFHLLQMGRLGDITSTLYNITHKSPAIKQPSPCPESKALLRTPDHLEFLRRSLEKRNLLDYFVQDVKSSKALRHVPLSVSVCNSLPFKVSDYTERSNAIKDMMIDLMRIEGPKTEQQLLDSLLPHFGESDIRRELKRAKYSDVQSYRGSPEVDKRRLYSMTVAPRIKVLGTTRAEVEDPLLTLNSTIYYITRHFSVEIQNDSHVKSMVSFLPGYVMKKEYVAVKRPGVIEAEAKAREETLEQRLERQAEEELEELERIKKIKEVHGIHMKTYRKREKKQKRDRNIPLVKRSHFDPEAWRDEWLLGYREIDPSFTLSNVHVSSTAPQVSSSRKKREGSSTTMAPPVVQRSKPSKSKPPKDRDIPMSQPAHAFDSDKATQDGYMSQPDPTTAAATSVPLPMAMSIPEFKEYLQQQEQDDEEYGRYDLSQQSQSAVSLPSSHLPVSQNYDFNTSSTMNPLSFMFG
eukprot:gene2254-2554_t